MHEQITALLNSGGFLAFSIPKVEQSSNRSGGGKAGEAVSDNIDGWSLASVINSLRKINPVLCGNLQFLYIPQNYFAVQVDLAQKDDRVEVGIVNRHCYLTNDVSRQPKAGRLDCTVISIH